MSGKSEPWSKLAHGILINCQAFGLYSPGFCACFCSFPPGFLLPLTCRESLDGPATGGWIRSRSQQLQPNVFSYNAAVSACEKAGHWEQALALFAAMLLGEALVFFFLRYLSCFGDWRPGGRCKELGASTSHPVQLLGVEWFLVDLDVVATKS